MIDTKFDQIELAEGFCKIDKEINMLSYTIARDLIGFSEEHKRDEHHATSRIIT